MSEPRPKRRRFLVDPELQIGLSTEMVGWIYVYFLVFAVVANLGNVLTVLTAGAEEAAYLAAMDEIRGFARYVVLPMGVTFVAMAVHGVFLTHRIAGPIVRLKRTMREIASRRLPSPITLRRKDHFKDLADEVNAAVGVLREDTTRRRRMSEEVLQATHRLVRALENPAGDRREALALAHSVLDAAEGLSRHLAVTTESTQQDPDAPGHVPLPEAEIPAVVSEQIDELDPEVTTVPASSAK